MLSWGNLELLLFSFLILACLDTLPNQPAADRQQPSNAIADAIFCRDTVYLLMLVENLSTKLQYLG